MSFLDIILRRQPDPTVDWPKVTRAMPAVGVAPFRLGSLKLGDRVDSARFLGQPDKVRRWKLPGMYELKYSDWRLALQFEDHRLVEVEFMPGDSDRLSAGSAPATVLLEDGTRITGETSVEGLIHRFGEPTLHTVDEGKADLQFKDGHNIWEFEYDEEGHLTYWCVYPNE